MGFETEFDPIFDNKDFFKNVMRVPICQSALSAPFNKMNAKRLAYYSELKGVMETGKEFDQISQAITQPFSLDKAIHG